MQEGMTLSQNIENLISDLSKANEKFSQIKGAISVLEPQAEKAVKDVQAILPELQKLDPEFAELVSAYIKQPRNVKLAEAIVTRSNEIVEDVNKTLKVNINEGD